MIKQKIKYESDHLELKKDQIKYLDKQSKKIDEGDKIILKSDEDIENFFNSL